MSVSVAVAVCVFAGTDEAHKYLWTMQGTTLELTHNYGTETDDNQKYHPGNQVSM